jgi:putative transposase
MVKVMRYQIIKPMDTDWGTFGDILRELQRETRTALNKTIQLAWEYAGFSAEYNVVHGTYPSAKKVLDYSSLHGYAYDRLKSECGKLNTGNLSHSIKRAANKSIPS